MDSALILQDRFVGRLTAQRIRKLRGQEEKMAKYIMALDAGTTSNRCILFNRAGEMCSVAQKEFTQIFPKPGWVEHDANEIWSTQYFVAQEAMQKIGASAEDIAAIGITNQRETTIVWDRLTGEPVCNAIVWQCRRTADYAESLIAKGEAPLDPRKCRGCPRKSRERRPPLRDRRHLAHVEAELRQDPCDGLFERIEDHAL